MPLRTTQVPLANMSVERRAACAIHGKGASLNVFLFGLFQRFSSFHSPGHFIEGPSPVTLSLPVRPRPVRIRMKTGSQSRRGHSYEPPNGL